MSTTQQKRWPLAVCRYFRVSGRTQTPNRILQRCRLLFLRSMLTLAVLLLRSLTVEASPLPAYSVIGDLLFNLQPPDRVSPNDFGAFSLADPRFGAVSVTAAGTPSPFVTASADIGPNSMPSIFGRGAAILIYALEILGPAGPIPVLIDVAGAASGFSTAGASFAVESRWDLLDAGALLTGDDIRSGQLSGSFSQNFDHTVSLTLAANHVYSVFLLADAAGAATLEGSRATAAAFVDPVFSFGPGVDPLLYSLSLSDGIGNASPTPIPESGTLTFLSMGLVCLCLGRWLRTAL
jgi:hypothetical protein